MTWKFPHNWNVKWPEKRAELLLNLNILSEGKLSDGEPSNWQGVETNNDTLDDIIHFIFDDTDLGDNASSQIGLILIDQSEADALMLLTDELGKLIDKLKNAPQINYLSDPKWKFIEKLAKNAEIIIGQNGLPIWGA